MQDLVAAFLPKFAALAGARVARGVEIVQQRDGEAAEGLVRDLHAVAGEAGLLGLGSVVKLARACEEQGKRTRASWTDAEVSALLSSLRELQQAIDLAAHGPTS